MPHGADRFGGLALERGAEWRQVQVTVDAAELLAGLDHPGRAPAQRHLRVAPTLDVASVFAAEPKSSTRWHSSSAASGRGWAAHRGAAPCASRRSTSAGREARLGGCGRVLWPGPAARPRHQAPIRRGSLRSSYVLHCCEVGAADDLSRNRSYAILP